MEINCVRSRDAEREREIGRRPLLTRLQSDKTSRSADKERELRCLLPSLTRSDDSASRTSVYDRQQRYNSCRRRRSEETGILYPTHHSHPPQPTHAWMAIQPSNLPFFLGFHRLHSGCGGQSTSTRTGINDGHLHVRPCGLGLDSPSTQRYSHLFSLVKINVDTVRARLRRRYQPQLVVQ